MLASRRILLLFAVAFTSLSGTAQQRAGAGTQYGPATAQPGGIQPAATLIHKDEVPEEKPVVTQHSITLHGKTLAYTATTGRMPIKTSAGVTDAEMFYVAYTLDGATKKRPLTFVFNGGPGSATIWLHMGAFGPRKVRMLPNGFMPAPPFEIEDNEQTWLDQTDLVFIDAIGTGYSRALSPEAGKKYWGLLGDLDAFGEFIRLYLQKNSRWQSPLYLAGESYGTTRAAGLSGWLVDHGIALNGIVLISTVLNFQSTGFAVGNDLPYISFLPTYALTAAYHHKLAPELNDHPEALKKEVEAWATTEYPVILQKGDSLTPAEYQSAVDHLARFTGLSKTFIAHSDLRVDLSHFDAELLREEGKTVGRLDGRFTGTNASGTQQSTDFDPSEAGIRPPYTSAFGDYVKQELNYDSDLVYWVLGGGIGPWEYPGGGRSGFPDVSQMLLRAFAKNPYMHVLVAEGYYDAATPLFGVEYTLNHMGLTPEMHKNIVRDTFVAGHMVYIDTPSIKKLKKDVDTLYRETAPK
ncbi:S10 family peptidase [Terriglobus saanensis]|uniref:Peptidase S10 serine carboxypeptidase n=1 Tax=Terriglobus saanensis (strain ATCC BAA-1853 / DSM 23119 / SP1PR4) TaxID=401053 RepID=E8V8T3_TERSS|nr:peptidase S10 [Terriglobus saanensis]ADV84120.1 peptidase S10 serine carboxypeptidase [Terriglobus saanensis SP1PR4]